MIGMAEFAIRIGTVDDAALLSRLGAETFWKTYSEEPKMDPNGLRAYIEQAFDEELIRAELQDEGFRYLVAEEDGVAAGYVRLKIGSYAEKLSAKRPLEISKIYLLPNFQGSGRGRKLMERCFEEAGRFSCDAVWLSVWRHNEKAIGFYKKMGFEMAGTVYFNLAGSVQKDFMMARSLES